MKLTQIRERLKEKYLGGCAKLRKKHKIKGSCCESCHYDNDQINIEMCFIETPKGYYEVCCSMTLCYHALTDLKPLIGEE